jgi:hypothetical protein
MKIEGLQFFPESYQYHCIRRTGALLSSHELSFIASFEQEICYLAFAVFTLSSNCKRQRISEIMLLIL